VSGLSIKDGTEVECGGRRFIIMQLIGFDFVVARDIETDDLVRLAVVDLNPVSPAPSPVPSLPDLRKVDDRDWAEARRRLDLIAPLLDGTLPARGHRRAGPSRRPGCLDALPLGPGVPRVGAALVAASV
jgi:hypothetical protein